MDLRGAAIAAVLAFIAYVIGLGASDLIGDPLKYALNVSYPHPPLVRGIMWWGQSLFGATPFVARLPLVMVSACAVGMAWLLLRHVRVAQIPAALLTVGFALTPIWSVVVRDGYLGTVLAACWLLAIIGIAAIENGRMRAGLLAVFIAIIAGLWAQIQNLWMFPAILVATWQLRAQWPKMDRPERTLFVLIPVNIAAWGTYVLTNPLIVGDMLFFVKDRTENLFLTPSISFMTAALVIFAIWGYRVATQKRVPFSAWEWAAGTLCLTVTPLVLYNPVGWYGPYLWACVIIAVASLFRAAPRAASLPVVIPAIILLAWGGWSAWAVEQPYRTNAAAVRTILGNAEEIIILGVHGYEWSAALPTVNHRLPKSAEIRAHATHAIAPNPSTLTPEERAWASAQTRIANVGDIVIYVITNP